ncbi:hypothetical protein [Bradyrhizobium valentinum]|uniref:hypothetical protein n=1 Tax=Bradyrhizobium valentinum TaxID=1518501 RepID=UPI0018D25F68|nr:hypothetical protein [Bradyrhizobium valentinum]
MDALGRNEGNGTLEARGDVFDFLVEAVFAQDILHTDHEKIKALSRLFHHGIGSPLDWGTRGYLDIAHALPVGLCDRRGGFSYDRLVSLFILALFLALSLPLFGTGTYMENRNWEAARSREQAGDTRGSRSRFRPRRAAGARDWRQNRFARTPRAQGPNRGKRRSRSPARRDQFLPHRM